MYFQPRVLKVCSVLEDHLSGKHCGFPREYLVGSGSGKFSIADMGIWPHIRGYSITGFSEEDRASFPSLLKWIDRIAQREAVKIAVSSKYDSEKNPALVVRTA